MTIGDRIKKFRIERQMTQQEVCGSYITRNMLSRIENNSAMPSVQTMEHIAGRLGVPVGALFDDDIPTAPASSREMAHTQHLLARLAQADGAQQRDEAFTRYLDWCDETVGLGRAIYLACVMGAGGEALCQAAQVLVRDAAMDGHLRARQAMREGRLAEAAAALDKLHASDPEMQERIYADLEQCYVEMGDYKRAYRCAAQRRILIGGDSSA